MLLFTYPLPNKKQNEMEDTLERSRIELTAVAPTSTVKIKSKDSLFLCHSDDMSVNNKSVKSTEQFSVSI